MKVAVIGAGRIGRVHIENISTGVREIINDKIPPVTDLDGLYPVLMAAAANKSINEGRPVKISEVDV